MKSSLTLFLLILAVSAVPALAATLESQYLVVVGADAPASDVVMGANFAASMKGSVAVTFSSAIDTELYAQITDEELASKTIVVIDGENRAVRILGTSNAAAAAQTYFSRQGFETELVTSPLREDILVDRESTTPEDVADDEEQLEEPETRPAAQSTPPVEQQAPAITVQAEATGSADPAPALPEPQDAPEQRPGVFTRIASWFRGLF